jgi:hypothetical protein
MKEIVAAKIGTLITTERKAIIAALDANADVQFLDRRHMQLMAGFDLGPQWTALANAPTLFCVGADGKPCAPSPVSERADP